MAGDKVCNRSAPTGRCCHRKQMYISSKMHQVEAGNTQHARASCRPDSSPTPLSLWQQLLAAPPFLLPTSSLVGETPGGRQRCKHAQRALCIQQQQQQQSLSKTQNRLYLLVPQPPLFLHPAPRLKKNRLSF
ncbi:unnamed protein product [Ectocarpus sp. 8 AP-2014]